MRALISISGHSPPLLQSLRTSHLVGMEGNEDRPKRFGCPATQTLRSMSTDSGLTPTNLVRFRRGGARNSKFTKSAQSEPTWPEIGYHGAISSHPAALRRGQSGAPGRRLRCVHAYGACVRACGAPLACRCISGASRAHRPPGDAGRRLRRAAPRAHRYRRMRSDGGAPAGEGGPGAAGAVGRRHVGVGAGPCWASPQHCASSRLSSRRRVQISPLGPMRLSSHARFSKRRCPEFHRPKV